MTTFSMEFLYTCNCILFSTTNYTQYNVNYNFTVQVIQKKLIEPCNSSGSDIGKLNDKKKYLMLNVHLVFYCVSVLIAALFIKYVVTSV